MRKIITHKYHHTNLNQILHNFKNKELIEKAEKIEKLIRNFEIVYYTKKYIYV